MSWYEYCHYQDWIYPSNVAIEYINLHFDFKNSLQCIYLIINVIFTLLESISMNFKVFLLIFDISIFIKKKNPSIYLRYIHKMQVPIYPSKPIFPTLAIVKLLCQERSVRYIMESQDI